MIFVPKPRTVLDWSTFDKRSSHGIKLRFVSLATGGVEKLYNCTIEPAHYPIFSAGILRQRFLSFPMQRDQVIVRLSDHRREPIVKKIQTKGQVNDRSDDGRAPYDVATVVRPATYFAGEFESSPGTMLPEIDAVPQPVIVIFTRDQ